MPIREIPKAYEYTCDICGKTHLQENAGGHYTDSRPPYWARLIFRRAATDFQGQEVADASFERLLCEICVPALLKAINDASTELRLRRQLP